MFIVRFVLLTCIVCIFRLLVFCIAIYCNLLCWRDYYYFFFTYIHVLLLINKSQTLLVVMLKGTLMVNLKKNILLNPTLNNIL